MSSSLQPSSPPPRNDIPTQSGFRPGRPRKQSSGSLNGDEDEFDWDAMPAAPENAVTEKVLSNPTPPGPHSDVPFEVPSSTPRYPIKSLNSTKDITAQNSRTDRQPNSKEWSSETSSGYVITMMQSPGTGIYRKTTEVWRVSSAHAGPELNSSNDPFPKPLTIPAETGIVRKKLPLWRVTTKQEPHDEEAGNAPFDTETPKTLRIRHDWQQTVANDEPTCAIHVFRDPNVPTNVDSHHILWVHLDGRSMALDSMAKMVQEHAARDLTKGDRDLIPALLKRVRVDAEKPFVNGKFLEPLVRRYDGQPIRKDGEDKPSLFVNFPFLALMERDQKPPTKKGPQHTVRTLLQSRYRLQSMTIRDTKQVMIKLTDAEIKTCISRVNKAKESESAPSSGFGLLHVPQIWAVILSNGALVTKSAFSHSALMGPIIRALEPGHTAERNPILVQINITQDKDERGFIYPVQQCSSWLALLNKQAQILKTLGSPAAREAKKYKYYTSRNSEITSSTWVEVLRDEKSEVVSIRLKEDTPDIKVQSAGTAREQSGGNAKGSSERVGQSRSATTEDKAAQLPDRSVQSKKATLGEVPENRAVNGTNTKDYVGSVFAKDALKITPFLEWPVIDRFGQRDPRSAHKRVQDHLADVAQGLVERFALRLGTREPDAEVEEIFSYGGSKLGEIVRGLTQDQMLEAARKAESSPEVLIAQTAFIEMARNFLHLFISQEAGSGTSQAMRTFWGAILLILVRETQSDFVLQELARSLDPISKSLKTLRIEMNCFDNTSLDDAQEAADPHGAVLLIAIIDGFASVISLFIDAALYLYPRWEEGNSKAESHDEIKFRGENLGSHLQSEVRGSCKIWNLARKQLIVEQGGDAHNVGLGPVVTPEGIMILLMKRLALGVYKSHSIDVVELYEKCLEKLALDVEENASRRLLQELNSFVEEVDIITSVMKQQCDVLRSFQHKLDPQTFENPSPFRLMQFQHESKFIDTLVTSIERKILDCGELRERASRLTTENVQLVETKQDENSNAIFIFTIVTIVFLPLTFVTGFFGMNLSGIAGTSSTTSHFWAVAVPFTVGVGLLCVGTVYRRKIFRRQKDKRSCLKVHI